MGVIVSIWGVMEGWCCFFRGFMVVVVIFFREGMVVIFFSRGMEVIFFSRVICSRVMGVIFFRGGMGVIFSRVMVFMVGL